MRLIDADETIREIVWNSLSESGEAIEATAKAIRCIENMPSIERKKGKWHRRIYSQIEMMVCSECQEEFSYDAETGIRDYNYCPSCGSDMRERKKNDYNNTYWLVSGWIYNRCCICVYCF